MFKVFKKNISLLKNQSCQQTCKKYTLPDLPYDYDALEPYISSEIMKLHHTKHHATYINNYNIVEDKLSEALSKNDAKVVISLEPALRFNGGGHINHSIFWTILSPNGGGEPSGQLLKQIQKDFASYDNCKEKLIATSVAIQGSGWGWLGWNKILKRLEIAVCANQDPLEPTTGLLPVFGIDCWEHAYYLQYKNVRADYVKQIFNVANWENISKTFHDYLKL